MMFVIARYNENTSWTDILTEKFIVQKDEHFPNWGREPSSFLWYIIEHYETLQGDYAFIQASPFPHCKDFFQAVKEEHNGFKWLGHEVLRSESNGNPHDPGLPLASVAEQLGLKTSFPVQFCAGGQFIVTAERIRQRPREWYQRALQIMYDSHRGEYCFERLWGEIFK